MSELNSRKEHICAECGDRIFRRGFNINNKLYCKHCVYALFGVKFNDDEYIREESEQADNDTSQN